jgi:V8-like Glu-specific endopeptidase
MARFDDLILPEDKPGNDGRIVVSYPSICKLSLTRSNDGAIGEGTGFLIDSTTVITAGHNIIDKDTGSAISSIKARFPDSGRTINAKKFKEFGPKETTRDMGVILLSEPHILQQYITLRFSTSERPNLEICGYEMNDDTCLGMSGLAELRGDGFYYYEMDTRQGQSGGPALLKGTLTAIGVHVGYGANSTRNRAAPLSSDFKNFITRVRTS